MNTNAKHTPGPWTAASQDTETNEIPIKCGKSILARVAPRPHRDATQEANARLIAAAPELLAAVRSHHSAEAPSAFEASGHNSAPRKGQQSCA